MNFDSSDSSKLTRQTITTFENETDTLKMTYQTADNLHTVVIRTTEDKLRNHLKNYKDVSTYPSYFLGILGIAVTLIITLATIESFQVRWGIPAPVWQAFFMLLTVMMVVFLFYFGFKWYQNRSTLSIDNLIKDIKNK